MQWTILQTGQRNIAPGRPKPGQGHAGSGARLPWRAGPTGQGPRPAEMVSGGVGHPIKGAPTIGGRLLPLDVTARGETLAGAGGHRASPRDLLRPRRGHRATRRTPVISTRGGRGGLGAGKQFTHARPKWRAPGFIGVLTLVLLDPR
jgi:hypothetical protein